MGKGTVVDHFIMVQSSDPATTAAHDWSSAPEITTATQYDARYTMRVHHDN